MVENPFIIKGYKSADLFCDRDAETNALLSNIKNGADTTLISPRKYGKTGLIFHTFEKIRAKKLPFETLYVDIFATQKLSDFTKALADAVLAKFPAKKSIGKQFMELLQGFRPMFTMDPLSGSPQVQFNYVNASDKEYTLKSVLEFLNSQKRQVVLAIDEFQQITEYPEKNVEALLRTYTQQLHNIRFVYCGSKRSLMTEMFLDAKRPFFSSSNMLNLDKIDREIYGSFIKRLFGKYDIPVDDDALTFILDWTRCHTFYTQNLCNVIFSMEPSRVNLKVARESALYILEREAYNFLQYRELVTTQQWLMLIGIAKEGSVSKITSSEFLRKYDIGSVTNAKRIVESLVQKDMLLQTVGIKETCYQVYNVFFSRWLEGL